MIKSINIIDTGIVRDVAKILNSEERITFDLASLRQGSMCHEKAYREFTETSGDEIHISRLLGPEEKIRLFGEMQLLALR